MGACFNHTLSLEFSYFYKWEFERNDTHITFVDGLLSMKIWLQFGYNKQNAQEIAVQTSV